MVRRLRRHQLVATWNGSFAALVGVRRRALALLAAIRSLLIEPSTSEAIERLNQQQDCQEGNGNMNASTHSAPE